jgi:nitroreductase
MNPKCYDEIVNRIEVREFSDEPVPLEVAKKVVDAARKAPSAYNRQPWAFVLVNDRELLKKLGDKAPSGPYIKNSAFAVVVLVDPRNPFHVIDGTRAMQTMMLAAWILGLGSCWVSNIDRDEVKRMLKVPENLHILAIAPFGYPKRKFRGKKARKPLEEIAFLNEYGNPLK